MNQDEELYKNIKNAPDEKTVEHAYWIIFSKYYPASITSPFKTDGLLIDEITTLIECKIKMDITESSDQSKILIQSIFYLKQMETDGKILPKSIFIGTDSACMCISVKSIISYLGRDIDWCIAPSSAHKMYPDIVNELMKDKTQETYIFQIDKNFKFEQVISILKKIESNESRLIKITNNNIINIFDSFVDQNIIIDLSYTANKCASKNQTDIFKKRIKKLSDIFMDCLADSNTVIHPSKPNILINRGNSIQIDSKKYKMFFNQYDSYYSPEELRKLTSVKDLIFQTVYKRNTGSYYTPKEWVDESHKCISSCLGSNWKEEYIVWDCAAGTANLTKDYNFAELYISTLESEDISTIDDMEYNIESIKFKYDFLNEYDLYSVPNGIKQSMSDQKKLLFYINPPYGRYNGNSKIMGSMSLKVKDRHIVSKAMKQDNMGSASLQLYAQFMYKIAKLKENNPNIALAIFNQPSFLTSNVYRKFRNFWFKRFKLKHGFQFRATEFRGLSDGAIIFTIWE